MILNEHFILGEKDHKTHITFAFQVEKGTDQLDVDFSFDLKLIHDRELLERKIDEEASVYPAAMREKLKQQARKTDRTLSNMVSLSLISPSGFAGCVHRGSSHFIVKIRKDYASPGFYPVQPQEGEWKLVLSVDSLYRETAASLAVRSSEDEQK